MSGPAVLGLRHEPDGVLVVTGCLDLSTAPLFQRALAAARGSNPRTEQIVDLRLVSYLDSYGVTVLLQHAPALRLLVASSTAVSTVVRISGLAAAMPVEFLPAA